MTGANPTAAVPNCPDLQELLFCEQGLGGKTVEIEGRAAAVVGRTLTLHLV